MEQNGIEELWGSHRLKVISNKRLFLHFLPLTPPLSPKGGGNRGSKIYLRFFYTPLTQVLHTRANLFPAEIHHRNHRQRETGCIHPKDIPPTL